MKLKGDQRALIAQSLRDQKLYYHFGMREVITFRPKRPKRQLHAAFGNMSTKLNELLERELSLAPPPDWREVLKRPGARTPPEGL